MKLLYFNSKIIWEIRFIWYLRMCVCEWPRENHYRTCYAVAATNRMLISCNYIQVPTSFVCLLTYCVNFFYTHILICLYTYCYKYSVTLKTLREHFSLLEFSLHFYYLCLAEKNRLWANMQKSLGNISPYTIASLDRMASKSKASGVELSTETIQI